MGTAQRTNQPMGGWAEPDPVDTFLARAPMDPVSPPLHSDGFDLFTFSLRESFRHVSLWFTLVLNHAYSS